MLSYFTDIFQKPPSSQTNRDTASNCVYNSEARFTAGVPPQGWKLEDV